MKRMLVVVLTTTLVAILLTGCSFLTPRAEVIHSWMSPYTYEVTCMIKNTGSTPISMGVVSVGWFFRFEADGYIAMNQVMFGPLGVGEQTTILIPFPGGEQTWIPAYDVKIRELRH